MIIIQLTEEQLKQLIESAVNKAVNNSRQHNTKTDSDEWFDITELCDYHPNKPKIQTVYSWVNKKFIPYHKSGKFLSFNKSEIDNWLQEGLQKTSLQIKRQNEAETDMFLSEQRNIKTKSKKKLFQKSKPQ